MRGALRGWRLVPVAGAAWVAAAVGVMAPAVAGIGALTLWALVVVAVSGMRWRPSLGWALLAVAAAAAAVVSTHVAVAQPARNAATELAGSGGRSLVAEVRVSGRVSPGVTGDVWFDAVAVRVRAGERELIAALPVRVGVTAEDAGSLQTADLGARLTVQGSAIPVDRGDRAAIVLRAHGAVVVVEPPAGVLGILAVLRAGLARSAAGMPGPGAALIPGLATGDTAAVDVGLAEAMKASSLSHLTAVSGANCAIVVGLAVGIAGLCGAPRGARVGVGLAALTMFVLLVTPEPSVVRAAAMAAIAMIALLLGRPGAGLAALSLAVTVILALDPWLALSLGFALSSVATGALLVFARPLADGLARHVPRPLALGIAVPLAAQLACAPLLVLIDPRVPLLGVLANMLAAPAAPVATIAGFLACLAAPLPWLQDGLVAIAWLPATWIAEVARTVSAIPAQQLPWLEGAPGALTLGLVCVAIGGAIALSRGEGRMVRMVRLACLAGVALVIGGAAAHTTLQTIGGTWTVPAESWRVAVCDVGQGDAVLLRSAGAVALIDSGPHPAPLSTCLRRFGVDRIDLLVVTHFDLDHVGGVAAVTGRVGTVLHGPPANRKDQRTLATLADAGASLVAASAGQSGMLGAARWQVLWPKASVDHVGNDASVVLVVEGDGLPRTVLLGDLSAEPQARIRPALTDADVVKVAHHGSADQDPQLYERVAAELALIPVGSDNDYGHPRASLLATLTAHGTAIARTDRDGAIAVWTEGGMLRVWRERSVDEAR